MPYEEKYRKLLVFIQNYKEAVESMDISMIEGSEYFVKGELSAINAIQHKIGKLERNKT